MASLMRRDGTRIHNWTTNRKAIDREADRLARAFICGANHLTPAVEAELDNLLKALPKPEHERIEDTNEPDPEIIAQLNADPGNWDDKAEPSDEALDAIDAE